MIIGMLGGIMVPMVPAQAMSAAAKSLAYPFRSMAGIITEPTAAESAAAEPEMPAKNMLATTDTMASPPVTHPTRTLAKLISRREMPPLSIKAPAKQEERHRLENRGVRPPEHLLRDQRERNIREQRQEERRREAEGDGDGHVDGEEAQKECRRGGG